MGRARLTKRGVTVARHMLPEPSEFDQAVALRRLSGEAEEQARWPTYYIGHRLIVPPRYVDLTRAQPIEDLQRAVGFEFDGLFAKEIE